MNHREYESALSFTDLAFCIMLGFLALFALSFIQMNTPQEATGKVDLRAEYLITLSWPDRNNDDLDLYVEDAAGNLVNFQSREAGLMHLDRDDQGNRWDVVQLPNGHEIVLVDNREIVTLRGTIAGEYVVNVHAYAKRENSPTTAKIKIEKLQPKNHTVFEIELLVRHPQDEITACRFVLDAQGEWQTSSRLSKRLVHVQ